MFFIFEWIKRNLTNFSPFRGKILMATVRKIDDWPPWK